MDRNRKRAGKWNVDQTGINTMLPRAWTLHEERASSSPTGILCSFSHSLLTLWRDGKTRQGGGGVGRRDSGHVAAPGAGRSVETRGASIASLCPES